VTRLPSFDLKGEVALVTGASSGIGRHLAKLLAAAGAKVGLAARRADLLAGVASDIAAAGGESLPITCDVTRLDSVTAAVAKAESELGPLTILVNNAGVVVSKPLFEHSEADWDHVVDTNLKGAWLAAREFAHHLVGLKRPGRIINISSVLASRTIGRVPAYCAAKAGLCRDRFQSRLLPNRGRQGADFPHSAKAPRPDRGSRRCTIVPRLAGQRLCDRCGCRGRWRARGRCDLSRAMRGWPGFSPRRVGPRR